MREAIERVVNGGSLSEAEAESVFRVLLEGGSDEAQIGGLLAVLASRGPTADELVGAARVMRSVVAPVPVAEALRDRLVDTCGTGGAPKTFNVSTAAAIIAAAAGTLEGRSRRVLVAKHGNRSRTGRGSAEVLGALGVNVDAGPDVQARCLEEAGVCFCFAIHHHPAMRHAAGPRRSLGVPTIFNLLGPLTNPAGARRQLLGVYDRGKASLVARALARLGAERAMVAHGEDGLDELTTTAPTFVAWVSGERVREETVDAADLGVARAVMDDLRADSLNDAADLIRSILEPGGGGGGALDAKRDLALVNAAAALVVGGAADSMADGLALAREAVASGAAARTLGELVAASNA